MRGGQSGAWAPFSEASGGDLWSGMVYHQYFTMKWPMTRNQPHRNTATDMRPIRMVRLKRSRPISAKVRVSRGVRGGVIAVTLPRGLRPARALLGVR